MIKLLQDKISSNIKASSRFFKVCVSLIIFLGLGEGILHWIPLPERLATAPSVVVRYRDGTPSQVFLSDDDKVRIHTDLKRVDPRYVEALLRFEDKRFWDHPGVDQVAVLRSAFLNLRHGRVVSGASTLTMQLVRLLEPRPRTLRSKMVEALRALQLESRLSKEEILAHYLSFISYGGNVEGIESACWTYFGHGPERLSAAEIAILIAVPQKPVSRHLSPENTVRLREARDEIALWLGEEGVLEKSEGVSSIAVPLRPRPLPKEALHAAFWLRSRHGDLTDVSTTLDQGVQRLAERTLGRAGAGLAAQGIHNGAVVILDHTTFEIASLVGNVDFWDFEHGGQIPGFAVPRSPGSALKPFIYALALDRALVLPDHLVADVPASWAGYSPGNYDGDFAGLVPLEAALSESLNIPFVRLLGRVGLEPFLSFLRQGGAHSLSSVPGYYGLSAAVGSADLTPLELAGLYGLLAQGGQARPLRYLEDQSSGEFQQVLSPGASWLTRRALSRRDRPDFPDRRRWNPFNHAVHWKTGTSYGHRDAWAVGSGPRYTVVVWLGNFDRAPSRDLVGSEAAGPILFDLLEALADRSLDPRRAGPPGDLMPVKVCAFSGFLPSSACNTFREVLAPTATVSQDRCPYHVAMDVDLSTGRALNPSCRGGRRWERRTFLDFPAGLKAWLTGRHRILPSPPALAADCQSVAPRGKPRILSPRPRQVLLLMPGIPNHAQEIPLQAETGGGDAPLAWFVDGQFLAKVPAHEKVWWAPEEGQHEFLVVDGGGSSAKRTLTVKVPNI